MQSFNLYVYSLMALRQHNSTASHTKTNGYAGIFGDRLVLAFFYCLPPAINLLASILKFSRANQ